MNNRQISDAIKNNTFITIATIPFAKSQSKISLPQMIKILTNMNKRLNLIKSGKHEYQTVLNCNEKMEATIVAPFISNKVLNKFVASGNREISVKDLLIIFKPNEKDIVSLELNERNPNLFGNPSDHEENINDGLKEMRNILHLQALDAIKAATQLANELSTRPFTANELSEKLRDAKDAELVRQLIHENASKEFDLNLGDNSLTLGGNPHIPTFLPDSDYTLKNCRITEFLSKSSCNIYVAPENKEFLIKNLENSEHMLTANFIKDGYEHELLKYLEASKLKFDVDIQVNRAIINNRKTYTVLKIHQQETLINSVIARLAQLLNRKV